MPAPRSGDNGDAASTFARLPDQLPLGAFQIRPSHAPDGRQKRLATSTGAAVIEADAGSGGVRSRAMREAFEKVIDPDPARPPLLPLSPGVGDFGSRHAGPGVVVMGTDARHRSALARARMDNDVFRWEDSPGYAPQVHAAMQPHAAFKTR